MPASTSSTGEIVAGHFSLIAPLGAGAMGSVWRALDVKSGREVALKYIHPELTTQPSIVERFRREMAITSRIHSPYTVEVYEVGSAADGRQYLAMELVQGQSLASVIARAGALDPARIVRIGAQVAEALSAAHEVGVIHRDLKPDNIMLYERALGAGRHLERDCVKVLDFGVARLADNSPVDGEENWQTLTRQGALVGTPRYMAPEQISFEPVTTRTDLYALGVVLYEMAVGKAPFPCNSVREALNEHLFEEPVPPGRALGRPFPAALEQLILSLLEKEPKNRPESAARVARALNDALVNTAPDNEPRVRALPGGLSAVALPASAAAGTLVPEMSGTLVPDLAPSSSATLVPDEVRGRTPMASGRTIVPEADEIDAILRELERAPVRASSLTLIPDNLPAAQDETNMRDFDELMNARGGLRPAPALPELGEEAEPTEIVDRGRASMLAELGRDDVATQLADEEISKVIQGRIVEDSGRVLKVESGAGRDDTLLPVAPAAPAALPGEAARFWETPAALALAVVLALGVVALVWVAMG